MSIGIMKNKILKFQPPFREAELMPVSSFLNYCDENGVFTTEKELEQLHKEALLYPAVKLYIGVLKFKRIYAKFGESYEWRFVGLDGVKEFKPRKIEKPIYYRSGGFSRGRNNWLDHYKKNKMIEYPASQKFKAWCRTYHPEFTADLKLIENDYEFFYDKIQLLNLKMIKRENDLWPFFKDTTEAALADKLKDKLLDLNKFLELYLAIVEFFGRQREILNKKVDECMRQRIDREQTEEELKEVYEIDIKPELKGCAEVVLRQHSFLLDEIDEWRRFFAFQCVFYESRRSSKCTKAYLRSINEEDLIEAEDTNFMIHVINRFLFCLTGEGKTVKQILENSRYYRCPVCGIEFMPRKYTQKTCAKRECVRENKNRSKRKKIP